MILKKNDVLFVKIVAMVLKKNFFKKKLYGPFLWMGFNCIKAKVTVPWFWTYGLIRLLGPSGPNVVSRTETPWSIFF